MTKTTAHLSQATLQAHFDQELTGTQERTLQTHIETCIACREALAGYTTVQATGASIETDLAELARSRSYRASGRPARIRSWGTVGLVLLLLALGAAIWAYYRSAQPGRVYAAYFDPTPVQGYDVTRVVAPADPLPAGVRQALRYYEQREFALALAAFRTQLDRAPDDQRSRLYMALTYLQMHEPAPARAYLDTVLRHQPVMVPEALWYRSLTYLQEHDAAAAIPLLRSVVAHRHDRSVEAGEMLDRLQE